MATSIKLPEELKKRITRVVKGTEQSAHAFMVEAIRRETERAEKRGRYLADALASRDEMLRTGMGYAMEDVHAYILAKVKGKTARRPRPRRWRM